MTRWLAQALVLAVLLCAATMCTRVRGGQR